MDWELVPPSLGALTTLATAGIPPNQLPGPVAPASGTPGELVGGSPDAVDARRISGEVSHDRGADELPTGVAWPRAADTAPLPIPAEPRALGVDPYEPARVDPARPAVGAAVAGAAVIADTYGPMAVVNDGIMSSMIPV
jgi:hypothetical protein